MMRLELFVDDKKLAKIMHAIDGLVVQMTIGPVRNVVKKSAKMAEAGNPTTGREVIMEVIRVAAVSGKSMFDRKEVIRVGEEYGISKSQITSAIALMKKEKGIKAHSRGNYEFKTGEANG